MRPHSIRRYGAGRAAHHMPDGTFRNPPGSPRRGQAALRQTGPFMVDMLKRSFRRVDVPAGHIVDRDTALTELRAKLATEKDFLTWLGHASFLIRIGGLMVLTDPYLTSFAGPGRFGPRRFVKSGVAIRDLPPIDLLVISHNHYDHLDEKALARLQGKSEMIVAVPLKLGDFMRARGFPHVVELDWHDQLTLDGVEITALPVVHWSRRSGFDMNRTLWAGFGLRGPDHNLFFGGDSGYGPIFSDLGSQYGPFDTALLGIGAYEPRFIMQASHATPEEAIAMGLDLRARRIVGMHWGTVVLTTEPPFEPPERFLAEGQRLGLAEEDLWLMGIGETRALPSGWPANR